jgi:hypothetical protein
LAQLNFTSRAVFLENNFMSRGELWFCSFTMCLTLRERVFREAGQRAGHLAIEVVKLIVKPPMKLYQTGSKYQYLRWYSARPTEAASWQCKRLLSAKSTTRSPATGQRFIIFPLGFIQHTYKKREGTFSIQILVDS